MGRRPLHEKIEDKAADTCTRLYGWQWGVCAGVDQPGRAVPGDEIEAPMAGHILPCIQQFTNQGCIYHRGIEIWS